MKGGRPRCVDRDTEILREWQVVEAARKRFFERHQISQPTLSGILRRARNDGLIDAYAPPANVAEMKGGPNEPLAQVLACLGYTRAEVTKAARVTLKVAGEMCARAREVRRELRAEIIVPAMQLRKERAFNARASRLGRQIDLCRAAGDRQEWNPLTREQLSVLRCCTREPTLATVIWGLAGSQGLKHVWTTRMRCLWQRGYLGRSAEGWYLTAEGESILQATDGDLGGGNE